MSIRGWFGGWVDWVVGVVAEVVAEVVGSRGGWVRGGDWWAGWMLLRAAGLSVDLVFGDWRIAYPCVWGGVRCV